jgi:major membrane immunogen (membrane-anchored lipoprotein)
LAQRGAREDVGHKTTKTFTIEGTEITETEKELNDKETAKKSEEPEEKRSEKTKKGALSEARRDEEQDRR